jgi:hypothetical protein
MNSIKPYNTGGIDFYAELYSSLDGGDEVDSKNVCLITDNVLTDNHVILECGHKFNYVPLFNDIRAHKTKFNCLEANHVKINEIRCPYCRARQKTLLPYYPELGLPKIVGVNKEPLVLPSRVYIVGACQYEACSNTQYICKLECDGNLYCYTHYNMRQRAHQKEEKLKEKAAEKLMKQEQKKEQKLLETKQKAEAKAKAKEDLKNTILNVTANGLQEENTIVATAGCSQLMKTGLRKGQPCGVSVFCSGLCKRHYKVPVLEK